MTIPQFIIRSIARWAERLRARRTPDVTIGGEENPYLKRWWVIPRNPIFNIYLHELIRSDDDRALHDHPWFWCSIIVCGSYIERTIMAGGINLDRGYKSGSVRFHSPWYSHRLIVASGFEQLVAEKAADAMVCGQSVTSTEELKNISNTITLFITGPRLRNWGFHCPWGWRPWWEFTDASGAKVGRGCEP